MKNKRRTLLLLILLLLFVVAPALGQNIFQGSYGSANSEDYGYAIQTTPDGNFVVGGETIGMGAGASDGYLIKIDSAGNLLWTKTFGGTANDNIHGVQCLGNGEIITAGKVESFGIGNADIYLNKLDSAGNLFWSANYGTSDLSASSALTLTSDGNYVAVGYSWFAADANADNFHVIKVDNSANLLWKRSLEIQGNDHATSVIETADSGFIVIGYSERILSDSSSVLILKLNYAGAAIWWKNFFFQGSEKGYSVAEAQNGDLVFTGISSVPGSNNGHIFVSKTDSTGNLLWSKVFGKSGFSYEATDLKIINDAEFILTGSKTVADSNGIVDSDAILLKIDSSGNILWSMQYGNYEEQYGNSVCFTNDGGFIFAGHTGYTDTTGNFRNIFVVKTDSNGNSGCFQKTDTLVSSAVTFSITTTVGNTISLANKYATPTITGTGGISTDFCGATEILKNLREGKFNIYPNPGNGEFKLEYDFENKDQMMFEVFDVSGRIVFSKKLSGQKSPESLNLQHLGAGLYFYSVSGNGGKITSGKLVVAE
jgi:hypothetical protein